jgi:hypothetical protein
MPQGLQVFNSSGVLIVDMTDRLTRTIGEIDTGVSNGSFIDPYLSTGTPWFFTLPSFDGFSVVDAPCSITISGNTISWIFDLSDGAVASSRKIIYGVY